MPDDKGFIEIQGQRFSKDVSDEDIAFILNQQAKSKPSGPMTVPPVNPDTGTAAMGPTMGAGDYAALLAKEMGPDLAMVGATMLPGVREATAPLWIARLGRYAKIAEKVYPAATRVAAAGVGRAAGTATGQAAGLATGAEWAPKSAGQVMGEQAESAALGAAQQATFGELLPKVATMAAHATVNAPSLPSKLEVFDKVKRWRNVQQAEKEVEKAKAARAAQMARESAEEARLNGMTEAKISAENIVKDIGDKYGPNQMEDLAGRLKTEIQAARQAEGKAKYGRLDDEAAVSLVPGGPGQVNAQPIVDTFMREFKKIPVGKGFWASPTAPPPDVARLAGAASRQEAAIGKAAQKVGRSAGDEALAVSQLLDYEKTAAAKIADFDKMAAAKIAEFNAATAGPVNSAQASVASGASAPRQVLDAIGKERDALLSSLDKGRDALRAEVLTKQKALAGGMSDAMVEAAVDLQLLKAAQDAQGKVPVAVVMRARSSFSRMKNDPNTSDEMKEILDVLIPRKSVEQIGLIDKTIHEGLSEINPKLIGTFEEAKAFWHQSAVIDDMVLYKLFKNGRSVKPLSDYIEENAPRDVERVRDVLRRTGDAEKYWPAVQRQKLSEMLTGSNGEVDLARLGRKLDDFGTSMPRLLRDAEGKLDPVMQSRVTELRRLSETYNKLSKKPALEVSARMERLDAVLGAKEEALAEAIKAGPGATKNFLQYVTSPHVLSGIALGRVFGWGPAAFGGLASATIGEASGTGAVKLLKLAENPAALAQFNRNLELYIQNGKATNLLNMKRIWDAGMKSHSTWEQAITDLTNGPMSGLMQPSHSPSERP